MAAIRERNKADGSVIFHVQVRMSGFPTRTASFPTKRAAERWGKTIEAEMIEGRHFRSSESRRRSLANAIDRYFEEELPKKRHDNMHRTCLNWWRKKIGDLRLADITPAILVEYRNKLSRETYTRAVPGARRTVLKAGEEPQKFTRSNASVNRYLACLSHVFTVARKEWHWATFNPFDGVSKLRESKGRVRYLTEEERERLLSETSKDDTLHTLVVLALSTAARVIKLERAEGDFARHYDHAVHGLSSYFVWLNRGKESVVVDLKQKTDRHLLERLLMRADVFVHNLAPGAAERMDIGNAQLLKRFPRLIACQISAYGAEGPYRERKGYDLLLQAEGGLASVTGTPEGPGRVGVSICDIGAGLNAYSAVLEALIQRGITGKGRAIHISLFDTVADWMSVPLLQYEGSGKLPARIGLHHVSIAPYGVFQCADGEVLLSIQNEREWHNLCSGVLKDAALATDERFNNNTARVKHRAELEAIMHAAFAKLQRRDLLAALEQAGIAYGAMNSVADLAAHPHLRRGDTATPGGNASIPLPASMPADYKPGAVPDVGAHTDAVRREFA